MDCFVARAPRNDGVTGLLLATAKVRLSRCRAAREDPRIQGDNMNTVPDLNKATASAATRQAKTAAAPRIKLSPQGFCIDHPDPELGERLMADTLEVADPDA